MNFFRPAHALALFLVSVPCSFAADLVVEDPGGALASVQAPVVATVLLTPGEVQAAAEGRLQVCETSANPAGATCVPAQLFGQSEKNVPSRVCWLLPPGPGGRRTFTVKEVTRPTTDPCSATKDSSGGQFDLAEAGRQILRYNYQPVGPGDLLTNITPGNRIYARARSDYIHPLHGLDGETLTRDWSPDHPHHRGIYWAWPEVDWHGQRGDLHALQKVFARPTGLCTPSGGPVFAQINAENLWKWEDRDPIVRERTIIRAYRATPLGRLLDLEFEFTALGDSVLLARRETSHYGGLNLRLSAVNGQRITAHTDATDASPRMAWGEVAGTFVGAPSPGGIVVLQNSANPDYPGDWVQYAGLNWLQPVFPSRGTRFELKKGRPLVLRFRLWIHRGAPSGGETCAAQWRAYHSAAAPAFLKLP